jgi:glutathione S-transferase
MAYTLWGEPNSGSFMIEAALAIADQDVHLVDIDLDKNEQRGASYLTVNPSGKIPALRFPDGVLMTQSAAILIALDEAQPQAHLLPPVGHPERRAALRWLVHIVAEIYPLIEMSDYPLRFAPPETSEVGMRSLVHTRLRERWRLIEQAAAGGGTFLASGFSAIDLAITVITRWSIGADWLAKECPKLDAIAKSTRWRHKVGPVWQRHFGAEAASAA